LEYLQSVEYSPSLKPKLEKIRSFVFIRPKRKIAATNAINANGAAKINPLQLPAKGFKKYFAD